MLPHSERTSIGVGASMVDDAISTGLTMVRLLWLGSEPRAVGRSGAWAGGALGFGVGPATELGPGPDPGTRDMTKRSSWTILSYMAPDLGKELAAVGLSA